MAKFFTVATMAGAVLTGVLGAAVPANAQYYSGYGYGEPVYRTMPMRPLPPPPPYRVPYDRPYVHPYPQRPTYPVPPVVHPCTDQRGCWGSSGLPYRPGVARSCRGGRSNGVCYGGQRPGV